MKVTPFALAAIALCGMTILVGGSTLGASSGDDASVANGPSTTIFESFVSDGMDESQQDDNDRHKAAVPMIPGDLTMASAHALRGGASTKRLSDTDKAPGGPSLDALDSLNRDDLYESNNIEDAFPPRPSGYDLKGDRRDLSLVDSSDRSTVNDDSLSTNIDIDAAQGQPSSESSETCPNSPTWFEWNDQKRNCGFVSRRKNLCSENMKIRKFCPKACNACWFKCDDATMSFYKGKNMNKIWSCADIANLPPNRVSDLCVDPKIHSTCRKTCAEVPSAKFFNGIAANGNEVKKKCAWLAEQSTTKIANICAKVESAPSDGTPPAKDVCKTTCKTSLCTSCNTPSGINEGPNGISLQHVTELLDGTALGSPIPYLFLSLAEPLIGILSSSFETPIQFRQAMYHASSCYNTAAMYHPTALDIWGRYDKRVCLDEFSSETEKNAHEQVALAYTFAYSATIIAPGSADVISNIMDNVLKLPMSKLLESGDIGTPWGLAKAAVDQVDDYSKSDGWNHDGSLSNTFNKMPFSDFNYNGYSAYEPMSLFKDKSKEIQCDKEWHWEPLLETNGNGYFTKQEHVTPFAGFTGRLYGMTSTEYANFSVSEPQYDYCEEADFVISETNQMATDDRKKCELEFFDSKFTSLLPMQIDWSIKNQFSLFEFWLYDMALVTAMYDATMLVWREKVAFDAVRPTTVVHALKGEEEITTYAGPLEGSKVIKGMDWQPYIRTMPHAEYPSGSSCICTTYAETLQLLTGEDGTGQFPVGGSFEAGSLKTEPGVSPSNRVDLTYTKWSEVQRSCSQSRLYGGMHFTKAVPAGEDLCTGVASLIVDRVALLRLGDPSGALADLDDTSITVKKREA